MSWGERGIITDAQGQQILLGIYKSSGKHSRNNIENTIYNYTYKRHAKKLIKVAKEKGYVPVLISGGIDILVEKVAKEIGIDHWRANNFFYFDNEGYLEKIETLDNDNYTKLDQLNALSKELGFNLEDTICVGDGENEINIFRACRKGITFKGSKIEHEAWKVVESLKDIEMFL